ncbi:MAG: hypothetical protein V3S29_12055 [bacterium]
MSVGRMLATPPMALAGVGRKGGQRAFAGSFGADGGARLDV